MHSAIQNAILSTIIKLPFVIKTFVLSIFEWPFYLVPSINGLVTNGNTKLCCQAFILALFHSTTANKIDSEHVQDYMKLLSVCEVEILQVTVNAIKVFSSF